MINKNRQVSKVVSKKNVKKPLELVSDFKISLAKSLFRQRLLAELYAAFIDTKNRNGWTQNDIAKRIKMDPTQLSRLMRGRQNSVETETIALVALAMEYEPKISLRPIDVNAEVQPHDRIVKRIKVHSGWHVEYVAAPETRRVRIKNENVLNTEEDAECGWPNGATVHPNAIKLYDHV